jgi:hypothetical protein
VAGDEVYGADPDLRAELETHQVGYVLEARRIEQDAAMCGYVIDEDDGRPVGVCTPVAACPGSL